MYNIEKPIKRSRFRLYCGIKYYRAKRYLSWYMGNKKYAKHSSNIYYPFIRFSHSTPILRKLKNVDMWLQHNKAINLAIAIDCLDGLIIYPGETFSYWRMIGKPTKSKGYVEGMQLTSGTFKPSIGGGLCQLSNLIYWITLHTPLTVTERYRHSYDVFPDSNRTQPFGSGATCVYNYRDLQIYNGADMAYQLRLSIDNDMLNGFWVTPKPSKVRYEIYEKDHSITQGIWGGYIRNNNIYRRTYSLKSDKLIEDKYITENHAIMMYEPLLSGETIRVN